MTRFAQTKALGRDAQSLRARLEQLDAERRTLQEALGEGPCGPGCEQQGDSGGSPEAVPALLQRKDQSPGGQVVC